MGKRKPFQSASKVRSDKRPAGCPGAGSGPLVAAPGWGSLANDIGVKSLIIGTNRTPVKYYRRVAFVFSTGRIARKLPAKHSIGLLEEQKQREVAKCVLTILTCRALDLGKSGQMSRRRRPALKATPRQPKSPNPLCT